MTEARRIRVGGTVQGVGFRPFVARLAAVHQLAGWVRNDPHGIDIHVEGSRPAIDAFGCALTAEAPPAACVQSIDSIEAMPGGFGAFAIQESTRGDAPTARISPDLPLCADCLAEMLDPTARRFGYPYINCSNCGPRFSIIRALPYDRVHTTMAAWEMCDACAREYADPLDRRFHAEPIACPACGPGVRLRERHGETRGSAAAIARAADLLRSGAVVAIKGIGGYHLSCDAANEGAVAALRERKYRKAKPFAVMASDLIVARRLVELDAQGEALLTSPARPIVLARARVSPPEVAPGHRELGVMLPYAPIHHLLFRAGAPDAVVMTSANRSSEPIAYDDADAQERLTGIADAFLIGDRDIARRVDDSVARAGFAGPVILRRGRGYAPAVVGRLPATRPMVAVGADLKNTIAVVIDGDVVTGPHIGDLDHLSAYESFRTAIDDVIGMYGLNWADLLVVHDLHPHYASTAHALALPAGGHVAVQHHRAHVASVLVEHAALEKRVVGVAFDGSGYGDDGTIWGGEFFIGSAVSGLSRVASLRPFALPGGDAAARHPVQAAAGCLLDLESLSDLTATPFNFPARYRRARQLAHSGLRTWATTSAGRLFDTAAAVLGFTDAISYEGQAAIWLEQLAWGASAAGPLPFAVTAAHADLRPALRALIERRFAGDEPSILARAFHETVAAAIVTMAQRLCEEHGIDTIVLSGGVFQNALLTDCVKAGVASPFRLWTNINLPPSDGGLCVGQAALAVTACVS